MIVGANYHEDRNETVLTMIPYGGFSIPDKWTKTSYNRVSKQHYFQNSDSTTIALAKNPKDSYPFYNKSLSDQDYLREFAKWESTYFKEQFSATVDIIDDQSGKGHMIWKATLPSEGHTTIYVYGVKKDFTYNISGYSKTWSEQKIQDFLLKLFNDN